MITTDPIADFITRVRNAYLARQQVVLVPHSKVKEELAVLLKTNGYIQAVKVITNASKHQELQLKLAYFGKYPVLNGAQRLSKPGRRLYSQAQDLKPVFSGQGLTILSTSKGLTTDKQARKTHIGGELLCKIW